MYSSIHLFIYSSTYLFIFVQKYYLLCLYYSSLFDSNKARYKKMKSHIKNYVIIQFGLAAFHYDETTNSYSADVFNVYLFPRSFSTADVSFKFQSTSVQFLCRYNFDFNKVNFITYKLFLRIIGLCSRTVLIYFIFYLNCTPTYECKFLEMICISSSQQHFLYEKTHAVVITPFSNFCP